MSESLIDAIQHAGVESRSVVIVGSGSKAHLTRSSESQQEGSLDARLLSTVEHGGIVDYRPDELVVTARSGTGLKELKQALAREGQMLAFEPPEYQGLGTLGGAVASGLAGPGRPWRGAVRDSVLGVAMVNGLGQRLEFGGQVMKNVAGFDVSRLQAGAFGIFGLLLEVSLRVVPVPRYEETRLLEVAQAEALQMMRRWAALPVPLTAAAFEAGQLRIRLSGAESAVLEAGRRIGGECVVDDRYWTGLRDHSAPFFKGPGVAMQTVAPAVEIRDSDTLIEWNGARRWYQADAEWIPADAIIFGAGFARHRCEDASGQRTLATYQRRLKIAFDPDYLINAEICRADLAA